VAVLVSGIFAAVAILSRVKAQEGVKGRGQGGGQDRRGAAPGGGPGEGEGEGVRSSPTPSPINHGHHGNHGAHMHGEGLAGWHKFNSDGEDKVKGAGAGEGGGEGQREGAKEGEENSPLHLGGGRGDKFPSPAGDKVMMEDVYDAQGEV
jgi:hypothetical protein